MRPGVPRRSALRMTGRSRRLQSRPWPIPTPSAPAPRSPSAAGSSRSSASQRCRRSTTWPGCRTPCASCSRTCCGARTGSPSPRSDVEAVAGWNAAAEPSQEINYNPARVLLQDFTGVPAVVDLAAMRAAMADLGGDPQKINPLIPVELVIDHSVQVDDFATRFSIERNSDARVQPQPRALRLPPLGPGRLRELQGGAAEHRHLPPGQPRVPRPRGRGARRPGVSPTRSSAPTRTRRWSTGSACSAGASAGSRPRPRCSARRSRCSCRRSSASGSTAPCPRARRRPTSCSR